MINPKRFWHHVWAKLRQVRLWYLLIGLVACMSLSIWALRQNNLSALRLRDIVSQTDQQNGDTETALRNLRQYVYGHMNAQLSTGPNAIKPPIQLKYRFERLASAEKTKVSTVNAAVYTEAQSVCEQLFPQNISGGGRVPCIQDYVTRHGVKEQTIPDSLYKFDFIAPFWSPDLAGWSIVVTVLFGLLLITKYMLHFWLKHYLKQHL